MHQHADTGRADAGEHNVARTVYRWATRTDNLSLVLLDIGIVGVAWMLGFVAGFESQIPDAAQRHALLLLGLPILIQVSVHRLAGLYGPVWRYASVEEATRVIVAVAVGALSSATVLALASRIGGFDLPMFTTPPVAALLMLLGCGGVRFQSRLFALERQRTRGDDTVRALIVGAGSAGAALAYELAHTDSGRDVHVVGFVDDDERMRRRSVRGIPVLGDSTMLAELCEKHDVHRILVALPDQEREYTKPIVDRALNTSAQVKVLQSTSDKTSGLVHNVRDLDLSDLLGREPAPVDSEDIAKYLEGATVLVTGAGGSIGSEISRQVARYGPGRLLLLDRDESLLHDVAIGPLHDAETVLLDIRDDARLAELMRRTRPDVVFHAAANKHVPILERYPAQAATTNALSTWRLANLAAENGCHRFVHLSTDKAAHPCSVMGATKRAAEQIVVGVGRRHDLPYVAVRFGNVLGSRGSVVPTFLRQILDGGPVTVTSAEMTRYFMTIPEAVSLVLQSGAMAVEGKIFLLDMGEPASILALARQMIRLAGLRPDEDIEIQITGARPGERLHERLHDEAEEVEPADHPSISGLRPKVTMDWERLVASMEELQHSCDLGDDHAVRSALVGILRRGGVDCRLQSVPTSLPEAGGKESVEAPHLDIDLDRQVCTRRTPDGLAILTGANPNGSALPFARPARPDLDRVVERLRPAYESGMLTNSGLVRELEERVAEYLQVEHIVAVSSCTSGLMLTVQALVDGRPGPVVLPSFTFSASAHAVAWNGRAPRFVENDPRSFQFDVAHAAGALEDASAIMGTHVFGAPCDPERVEELAATAGIPVLFDAAHAFGATRHGRPIGGFGNAEVFSLTPTKPMVAGEGGLVATNDSDLAIRLRLGRDYGNPGDYNTRFVGLNARMSELHAAVALESLVMIDQTLQRRRELAMRYVAGLRDLPGIEVQLIPVGDISTYKDLTIAVDAERFGMHRDQLVTVLAADGIDTRNYFDPPVHRQQAYRSEAIATLPIADATSRRVVSLPLYPDLAEGDVDNVVGVIRLAHEHAEQVVHEIDLTDPHRLTV